MPELIRPFDSADIEIVRQLWTGADGLGFGPGDSEPVGNRCRSN